MDGIRRARSLSFIKSPRVTIQKDGGLGINRAAFELIDCPDRVVYLADQGSKAFGIKRAPEGAINSYPVRPQESGASYVVTARLFLQWAKIPFGDRAHFYTPTLEDGVLVVDLSNEIGGSSNGQAAK